MLKKLKQATLGSLKSSGVFTLVHNSRWRRQRLLILAYHGLSLDDEHLWDYTQFMPPEVFRARLQLLKKSGCAVLPLGAALERLYANDLPERSVALTFDDGTSDFYRQTFPLIKEFDFPVTLYLTTFYSDYNRPVFDVVCSYLLWKGRAATLDFNKLTGQELTADLSSARARARAMTELHQFSKRKKLSAEEKDVLALTLAAQLRVDYGRVLEKRMLHILNPEEVKQLAAGGVDIQLHTHRHRTPLDRQLFRREIADNRDSIERMTGTQATHFCYPSGVHHPSFLPWLREMNVTSATTCELGLASRSSNPLLLPRLLDISTLSPIEFESWLTGVAAAVPRKRESKNSGVQKVMAR
jgi:peptidoglycan/xylan/chitin deacetylase (PgdA/CDA1 family)